MASEGLARWKFQDGNDRSYLPGRLRRDLKYPEICRPGEED